MKDLQWIDACIDEEPEYPESPPPEMVLALQRAIEDADIDLLSEAFRITVRLTKQGIKDRIHERASLPSPSPLPAAPEENAIPKTECRINQWKGTQKP